jgi:O6-methylguanine-DNA--protein-cysteine methyltransferase
MARSDGSQGAFLTETPLGTVGLLWRETGGGPKVERVLLPAEPREVAERLKRDFPDRKPRDSPEVAELGQRIDRFLHGEPVAFDLGILALADCPDFQREVLLAESRIPRGWVSTYERIAQSVGAPRAAAPWGWRWRRVLFRS